MIPEAQLTPEQRETLEKLKKSSKRIEAEMAEVLERHGLPHVTTIELRCGFPPPGGCYCSSNGVWYCC
jgi:hypothetical protein